jgi:hypothetical protein
MRIEYKHNAKPYVTGIERRIGLPFYDDERESDHYCNLRTCDVVHLPRFPYLVERWFAVHA